ncbi:MAG TPA: hypothetical protein VIX58_03385 [Anaerolineae bacterium]|jgi:hypothetical protein
MMDSGWIGKVEKGKRYAEEANTRIEFLQFHATLKGDNGGHAVTYKNGDWSCDCNYFHTHQRCSHTFALGRVLGSMLGIEEPAAA